MSWDDELFGTIGEVGSTVGNGAARVGKYFKTHWVDYIIFIMILALLGTFDIFILGKSDNLGSLNYWLHAATRLGAYTLAIILGIRVGYPKYKEGCLDLQLALKYNRMLTVKRGVNFGDFINTINLEVKKAAWIDHINKKLGRLDRRSPAFFPLYYDSKDEKGVRSDKFFNGIKWKWVRNLVIKHANKYCQKRETLEKLITDEYIKKNIHLLNVKYNIVYKHDFDNVLGGDESYKSYQTRTRTGQAKSRAVVSGLIFTVIFILLIGSISLDFNEALAQERVLGIVSAIINGFVDIGLTLWKFVSGIGSCEKIVRQEDLRVAVDKNELLVLYCRQNGIAYPEPPTELEPQKQVENVQKAAAEV